MDHTPQLWGAAQGPWSVPKLCGLHTGTLLITADGLQGGHTELDQTSGRDVNPLLA